MYQEWWFIGGGGLFGAVATLLTLDIIRCLRRRADHRPPPLTRGQLHLFSDDGDHFLSAKLPIAGIQRLLDDYQRGRLG